MLKRIERREPFLARSFLRSLDPVFRIVFIPGGIFFYGPAVSTTKLAPIHILTLSITFYSELAIASTRGYGKYLKKVLNEILYFFNLKISLYLLIIPFPSSSGDCFKG